MNAEKGCFRPQEYYRPTSISEAVEYNLQYGEGARYVAGGTDLFVERDPSVKVLIDINDLRLNYISRDEDRLKIGAATTFTEIVEDEVISNGPFEILKDAAGKIGTPQIRNIATIGGNICYAVPSADLASLLLALDAIVVIVGKEKEHTMAIKDFFTGVRQCALEKGEILKEIQLTLPSGRMNAMFVKEGRVLTGDMALVNAAVRLGKNEEGHCIEPRIALGAVAPVPMRAEKAERILKGHKLDEGMYKAAAEQASREIKPISDVRASASYRKTLCKVVVERMLREVWYNLSP